MSFVELHALRKNFGSVRALDGIDLNIESGSRMVVVGPSGCGKTTLLRLVAGFETPDGGHIIIDGETVADGASIVPAYRRNIGVVAQDGCLFPHLSVVANIAFGMREDRAARGARAEVLMEMVGLDRSMSSRRPDELSGGQQQRVALARALARRPRLMLLDEPFSALDTGLRAATRQAVGDVLQAAGIATILVTHDQSEALAFADRLAIMRGGRLVQVGRPREVYSRPVDPETALFLGDAILLPALIGDGAAETPLGRLPVEIAGRPQGPATIMLRPEQISLCEIPSGDVRAQVREINFRGPSCDVRIVLYGEGELGLRIEVPSISDLSVGQEVGLRVSGSAHVFP
jgi:iron(III) transport system ATP-binding protein